MIPFHTRVVAIDDVEDHLQKIVWGLLQAGFCPIPYLFEDGRLENPPEKPLTGIRIVFSDIHMVKGGAANEKIHAANIINCLKKIIDGGPYALIFWSQFPDEAEVMIRLIKERAKEVGLTLPISFSSIDKKLVFDVAAGHVADLNSVKLREIILEKASTLKTLAVASSWESRVAKAAAKTTNELYSLANDNETWIKLLAYLAAEAAGIQAARRNVRESLDAALLPLLEDNLTLIGVDAKELNSDIFDIKKIIDGSRPKRPKAIRYEKLNSSYLIDFVSDLTSRKISERGMVTELGGAFIDSGDFIRSFGVCSKELIEQEFSNKELSLDQRSQAKLHIVELGPECDHAQSKVSSHRYLLGILFPVSMINFFVKDKSYRNASIWDSGDLFISSKDDKFRLLISCRCFMSLSPNHKIDGICKFRLRRALLEELSHAYTSHARRPGVMRFKE